LRVVIELAYDRGSALVRGWRRRPSPGTTVMLRQISRSHHTTVAAVSALGWLALGLLTFFPLAGLRPLEPSTTLVAAAVLTAVARLLAVQVFPGVLVAVDAAFYISIAFVDGVLAGGWLALTVLTGDALVRLLLAEHRPPARESLEKLITRGGLPALGLIATGLLFGVDRRWPMSDWQLAIVEPLFGATFIVGHYWVVGSRRRLAQLEIRRWSDWFMRVVLPELLLVPLALAMVVGHAYQGNGLFVLLGATCVTFNVVFRRASISTRKLHERIDELSSLDRVSRIIAGSLERSELLSNLARETLGLFGPGVSFLVGVAKAGSSRVEYELFGADGRGQRQFVRESDEGLSGWVMQHKKPLLLTDVARQYGTYRPGESPHDPAVASWLGVPMFTYQEVSGVISLQGRRKGAFTVDHQRVLSSIAGRAAVALENSRLYELATVDGLTGLLVRRHFEQRLAEEWSRAARYRSVFSLGIVDLDDFKALNDTYGHQAGDQALREAAATLRRNVRGADVIGRYGGEELAFLLPDTPLAEAMVVAERIRADLARQRILVGKSELRLTASLGLATFPDPRARDATDLIGLADLAMYRAKRLGKNRVCSAIETELPLADPEHAVERGVV
jgi:diguanylate cyclase (GGDEF)-like protein